jgi:hypothetical protein
MRFAGTSAGTFISQQESRHCESKIQFLWRLDPKLLDQVAFLHFIEFIEHFIGNCQEFFGILDFKFWPEHQSIIK